MHRMRLAILASLVLLAAGVPATAQQDRAETAAAMLRLQWSRGQAQGDGPVKLTTFPLRTEDIGHILPLGLMASGHVTPSDHLYLAPKGLQGNVPTDKAKRYDVLAVAEGFLVMIQWRPDGNPDPTVHKREFDYKVVLEHSATCWSYVDHLIAVDDALLKHVNQAVRPGQPVNARVPVKAGQTIGQIGAATFDFALVDTSVTRKHFIKPEQFLGRDPWKLHTVDPFDYLDEPLRSQLLALNPRKAEPRGGRIDYDVAGRLIGNWYREGTGGYAGVNRRLDYWIGHLTFAPHFVDPTQTIVSIGDFQGQPRQFQVAGNRPDPAEVTAADGLVKYELMMPNIDSRTGQPYPGFQPRPMGVLLAQLLDNGKLRVEVFPGKGPNEVQAFTPAAAVYER